MTLAQFHNGLRVLYCLSGDEFLACINDEDKEYYGADKLLEKFRANPHKYFVECPTQDAQRLFAVITKRNADAGLAA